MQRSSVSHEDKSPTAQELDMTDQITFVATDMVLQISGGPQNGQSISVNTEKCFLALEQQSIVVSENPQCAIFRGPKGAIIRGCCNEVTVNGESPDGHWLKKGDRISFSDSVTVEIMQMGKMSKQTDGQPVHSQFETVAGPDDSKIITNDCTQVENRIDNLTEQVDLLANLTTSPEPATEPETIISSATVEPLYSYTQDDSNDEKIMTFSELKTEPESLDAGLAAEITNDVSPVQEMPELNEIADDVESRLSRLNMVLENSEPLAFVAQPASGQNSNPIEIPDHGPDDQVDSLAIEQPAFDATIDENSPMSEEPAPAEEQTLQTENSMLTKESPTEDQPRQNESVSDLLARMKMEGQWGGLDENDSDTIQPVTPVAPPEPIADLPSSDENDDANVDDYMSQLLSRMRGDSSAETPATESKPTEGKTVTPVAEPEPEVPALPPVKPLTSEEFVPNRVAKKIDSFDAMRELANSSARTAVNRSESDRRKALGIVQIGIAASSFAMAVYYLVVNSQQLFDLGFCVGLVCVSISGFLGYRFYSTMRHNERMAALPKQEPESEVANAETIAEPQT